MGSSSIPVSASNNSSSSVISANGALCVAVGISFSISLLVTILLAYAPDQVGSGVIASSFVLYFLASLRIFLSPIPESLGAMYSGDELAIETFVMANENDTRMFCQPCSSTSNEDQEATASALSPKRRHRRQDSSSHCCCICLESMQPGQTITKSQLCRHTFHQGCLESWLSVENSQSSCPYCRRDLHRYAPAPNKLDTLTSDSKPGSLSIFENVFFSLES